MDANTINSDQIHPLRAEQSDLGPICLQNMVQFFTPAAYIQVH